MAAQRHDALIQRIRYLVHTHSVGQRIRPESPEGIMKLMLEHIDAISTEKGECPWCGSTDCPGRGCVHHGTVRRGPSPEELQKELDETKKQLLEAKQALEWRNEF